MIENIRYFYLLSLENIEEIDDTSNVVKLNIMNDRQFPDFIINHPYFCFAPEEFEKYSSSILERDNSYGSNDEDNEDSIFEEQFTPLEQLLGKFIFLTLKLSDELPENKFVIVERYSAAEVFGYWFRKNHFTDINQWRRLGLGEKIFNLLPVDHNYYDRNIICTCGHASCDNQEVWYVKYEQSYSIPFIIDLNKRLVFDLHYFDSGTNWEDEDYNEDDYSNSDRNGYSTFPFCFEAKDFKLFKKSIFPNNAIIDKYKNSILEIDL